jgi:exodeoxyribonuclease VII small subunit
MKNIEEMSFEEALDELNVTVKKLDSDKENLSDAIGAFERGVKLKAHCENKLAEAKLRVQKIISDASGKIAVEDIDLK